MVRYKRMHGPEGEDALQNAYLTEARIKKKRKIENSEAYIEVVARRNVVKQHVEVRKRVKQNQEIADEFTPSTPLNPEEALADKQSKQQLKQLVEDKLSKLPERQRQSLQKTKIENKSTEQTATEMGITPSGVKSNNHKGMNSLKKMLKEDPSFRQIVSEQGFLKKVSLLMGMVLTLIFMNTWSHFIPSNSTKEYSNKPSIRFLNIERTSFPQRINLVLNGYKNLSPDNLIVIKIPKTTTKSIAQIEKLFDSIKEIP